MVDEKTNQREPVIDAVIDTTRRGYAYEPSWQTAEGVAVTDGTNPLRAFFEARSQGRGIFKWDHYFEIYDRHFSKFRGQEVHVLEIGLNAGGSLDMWRDYFGPDAMLYGVDILPYCKAFESAKTKIFIGDQADRAFWRSFRAEVPVLDIVIDDGGHSPEQQAATLEELLCHLRSGGVYLCEDIHGAGNPFTVFTHGLAHKMNVTNLSAPNPPARSLVSITTPFQRAVSSMHFYPWVCVIERAPDSKTELVASKRGTEWPPEIG